MALRILLADDSMVAQNMGKKILSDAGYDVYVVSNGAAALKKFPDINPDIVLLDIYMPGYTGLEVCSRLKGAPQTAHIPVLLTVGKMEPFRPEDGMRAMADGMIIKPFEATDLVAVVGKLAERVRVKPAAAPAPAPEPLAERQSVFEEAAVTPAAEELPPAVMAAPAFAEDMLIVEAEHPVAPPAREVELPPLTESHAAQSEAEPILELEVEESAPVEIALVNEPQAVSAATDSEPVSVPEAVAAEEFAVAVELPGHLEPASDIALYDEISINTAPGERLTETLQAFDFAAETPEAAPVIESHAPVAVAAAVETAPEYAVAAVAAPSSAVTAMPFAAPAPLGQTSPDDDVIAKALAAMLQPSAEDSAGSPPAQSLEAFAASLGLPPLPEPAPQGLEANNNPLMTEAPAAVELPVFDSEEADVAEPTASAAEVPSSMEVPNLPEMPTEPVMEAPTLLELPAEAAADAAAHSEAIAEQPVPPSGETSRDTDYEAVATALAERVLERLKPQLIEEIKKELCRLGSTSA